MMNVKAISLIFFSLVVLQDPVYADATAMDSETSYIERKTTRFQYGIRLGVNSNALVGADAHRGLDVNRRAERFAGGAFLQIQLFRWIFVQPELLLSLKGTDFEFPNGDDDGGLYFDYLEAPALARFQLPWEIRLLDEVRMNGYILAGPWISVLLSAKTVNPDGSRSIRDAIKTFDFGVATGFGVAAEPVWWGAVELSARYVFGIPQIGDTEDGRDDAKHRTISVMLGFRCCAHRKKARAVDEADVPAKPVPPVEEVPVDVERDQSVDPHHPDEDISKQPTQLEPDGAGDSP